MLILKNVEDGTFITIIFILTLRFQIEIEKRNMKFLSTTFGFCHKFKHLNQERYHKCFSLLFFFLQKQKVIFNEKFFKYIFNTQTQGK